MSISKKEKKNRFSKIIIVIIFLAILVRLYVSFFTNLPHLHRDTYDYMKQADALLGGSYINYFPNGYPFIIALIKLISPSNYEAWLLVLNILLSVGVVYFVYSITQELFKKERIALFAALLLAVFPTQINYVRWLTSEIPSTFFLVGAYFFYLRKKNWPSGLFFGIATVIRTEFLPILFILFIVELIFKKTWNFKVVATAMLPILLVCMYCYKKTGQFSMAGHGKVNIMYAVTASGSYVDWYFIDKHPEIKTSGQAVKMYVDHFKESPLAYIKVRFINLWEMWGFYPSSSEGGRGAFSRILIGMCNLFLLLFGLMTWWRHRRDFLVFIMIIPFILITAIHILLLALPRYTYSIEPFMIVLAAYSCYNLIAQKFPN